MDVTTFEKLKTKVGQYRFLEKKGCRQCAPSSEIFLRSPKIHKTVLSFFISLTFFYSSLVSYGGNKNDYN